MSNYPEYAELEVEIEEILREREKVSVEEVCIELGIVKGRINTILRRYVCNVLKKRGWRYTSVYNKETKGTSKVWLNRGLMMDVGWLRGGKAKGEEEKGVVEKVNTGEEVEWVPGVRDDVAEEGGGENE